MLDYRSTLPRVIAERAESNPDRIWVQEVDGGSLTFGQANAVMDTWAGAFQRLGVQSGDRVVTMMQASLNSLQTWLGLSLVRAIDTGVNTDYRGRMLTYIIRNSGAKVLVVAQKYVSRLTELEVPLGGVEYVIVPDASETFPNIPRVSFLSAKEFVDGSPAAHDVQLPQPWDIANIIYTSGTTGPSKGVQIPWGQWYAFAEGAFDTASVNEDDVFYAPLAPFHGGGRMPALLTAAINARLVVRSQFSGTAFWSDVRTYGCTVGTLAGTMQSFLYGQEPKEDDADNPLRMAVMLPLIPQYKDFERRFGVRLSTTYAMTETPPVFRTDGEIPNAKTCGRLHRGVAGTEARIVDEHDMEAAVGTTGELIVRTSVPWTISTGYFGMPDTSISCWRNGWFHTGDAFRCDEDGYYYFVDRFKDSIRRRGENISSIEVEAEVNSHPAVLESAAIPVPSEWGEDEIKVLIVLKPNSSLTEETLVIFLVDRAPRFMVPRYVEIVEELPKTEATQRVRKFELRENALNDRTWDREKNSIYVPRPPTSYEGRTANEEDE